MKRLHWAVIDSRCKYLERMDGIHLGFWQQCRCIYRLLISHLKISFEFIHVSVTISRSELSRYWANYRSKTFVIAFWYQCIFKFASFPYIFFLINTISWMLTLFYLQKVYNSSFSGGGPQGWSIFYSIEWVT